jgi:hypothetical protein
VSEPLMTCRKGRNDVETGLGFLVRDEFEGSLPTARTASGMKAARAWSRRWQGTWEPVALIRVPSRGCREGDPQGDETSRGRVPMQGTGTDRPVVAMRPGNAGGAKRAGHPGSNGGQLFRCRMSR